MSNTRIPWFIALISILNIAGGAIFIGLAIASLLGFSILSGIISILSFILGLISFYIGKSLWKAKKWAYFGIILWTIAGIISSLLFLIFNLFRKGVIENTLGILLGIIIVFYLINNEKTKTYFGLSPHTSPKEIIYKSKKFLSEDSLNSLLIAIGIAITIIKFALFPLMSLATGTPLPLVIVESCSMYHESSFDDWWYKNEAWYSQKSITKSDFESYSIKNGLNKGDIVLVWGYSDYKKGDIIIFSSETKYPLIHRVVTLNPTSTKGDHNTDQIQSLETNIKDEQIHGKAILKIPALGWIKLILYEPLKSPEQRGLCSK